MPNKICSTPAEAVQDIADGATILIGGFGPAGSPANLILALRDHGASRLTVVSNNCGLADFVDLLAESGQMKKHIGSFPAVVSGTNHLERRAQAGSVEVETIPQGTLAERARAAGAGIPAFYTATGAGTWVERGKEVREFGGKRYLLERALGGDFALVKAWKADRLGNLVYRRTARNFNPVFATAAKVTIAEVEEIVEPGELDPEQIETPSIYVDRIVQIAPRAGWFGYPETRSELDQPALDRPNRDLIALRVAKELRDGDYVNLGFGLPTLLASYIPAELHVLFHAENGMLGYGPMPTDPSEWRFEQINAGGQPVSVLPGAGYFDSAQSFAMIRGGHLDLTVLGALQVSEQGDLANWIRPGRGLGSIGGAMDLVAGARRVVVAMEHTTKRGEPKIVRACTYPLTGQRVVDLIVTDLAVIEVTPNGLLLREVAPGLTVAEVQAKTEPKLIVSRDLREIEY